MSDTQYVCTAPLVDVIIGADGNGEGGAVQRIHQGGGLPPAGLYPPQVQHLLDRGMIAKAAITGGLESAVVASALAAGDPEPAKPTAGKRTS